MKKHEHIIEASLNNYRIVILMVTVLIIFGIYAIITMPRQEFPQFTIRQGLIVGIYPGATSEEVEEQLTDKVENYLFSYKEVNKKKTYSMSKENVLFLFVELNDNIKEQESKEFWLKLQDGLNNLKPQLPSGVSSLVADNDFGDTSALLLTLESDGLTYREMESQLQSFEKELRKVDAVSKIRDYGLQKEQITIYLQNEKISYYGLKPAFVLAALKTEGSVSYSGEIDDGNTIMPIHIPAKYHSETEIAEQIIYADPLGKIIRLKDVARIERSYPSPDSYISSNGKKCLIVSLEMQPGNNIVTFGIDIDKRISVFKKSAPIGLVIKKIADQPEVVYNAISRFLIEFLAAIFGVIAVTLLLLPLKVAAVSGSTIPIAILITIGIMYMLGVEFHTVSLAGLILVLGMVVDNAIVVIDSYVEKLDSGKERREAAIESIKELFTPVLTATLAIIAAFVPMLFALKGVTADFVKTLPVVVSIALLVSLLIVSMVLPFMNFKLIKKGVKEDNQKKAAAGKRSLLEKIQGIYDRTLEQVFRKPKWAIIGGALAFILGLVLLSTVPKQSFPMVDRNQFAVEINFPTGTSLEQNKKVCRKLENILLHDKRIVNVTTFIGTSSPRFHATYAPNMPGKNYSQMIVNTVSDKATKDVINEYSKKYRNYFPRAFIKWKQLELTFTRSSIEVRVSGDNIATLKKEAKRIEELIRKDNRVAWVRNDFGEQSRAVELDVLVPQANQLGYTNAIIGTSLAMDLKGFPVSTVWEGNYPVKVVLKKEPVAQPSVGSLKNTYIASPILPTINPVRQLADLHDSWSEGTIVRRNGVPTITVSVDVNPGVMVSKVQKEIEKKMKKQDFDKNVTITYGGDKELEAEVYPPMFKSLLISIFIIFFILLFQFRRIRLSLLIMTTMPLGIIGTALGLKLMGYPFGFTAFVGFVSLCGVVVRNGIIMIGYAEDKRQNEGLSVLDAAISAGKRRMRPIFLTSASAAVGVIPMIAGRSLLWGPLASVICFGLLFSMLLTLYFLPVAYWYLMREKKHKPERKKLKDITAASCYGETNA